MTVYGYARVSTISQNLATQKQALREAGVLTKNIYAEKFTGSTSKRPVFQELLNELKTGDTLVITKLDRLARNTRESLKIIEELMNKGVQINVLNMGTIENTAIGKLIYTVLSAVADMERDMIIERTQEGKRRAKQSNPNYKEGRPPRKLTKQYIHAVKLLEKNTYKNVSEKTGISISTLQRIKKQYYEEQEEKKRERK